MIKNLNKNIESSVLLINVIMKTTDISLSLILNSCIIVTEHKHYNNKHEESHHYKNAN